MLSFLSDSANMASPRIHWMRSGSSHLHIITTCTYPLPGNRCFYYNAPTQIKYTHQITVTHITAVRRTNEHQPNYDP